jgi:hypothetical protein
VSKHFWILSVGIVTLLTACGGSNKEDPNVGVYGYNGRPGIGFANQCSPRIAMLWNQNIASQCNNVNGPQMASSCASGVMNFRQATRSRALPCNIAVADAQWGNGQWNQPNSGYFEINEFVLDDLICKHGWAIGLPNRGQCLNQGPGFPSQPGRPGHPGHGPGPGPSF